MVRQVPEVISLQINVGFGVGISRQEFPLAESAHSRGEVVKARQVPSANLHCADVLAAHSLVIEFLQSVEIGVHILPG